MKGSNQIARSGKTKQQLYDCLTEKLDKNKSLLEEHKIQVTNITDGYSLKGEMTVAWVKTFHMAAEFIAKDGQIEVSYDTDAPEMIVKQALSKLENDLQTC